MKENIVNFLIQKKANCHGSCSIAQKQYGNNYKQNCNEYKYVVLSYRFYSISVFYQIAFNHSNINKYILYIICKIYLNIR